MSVCQTARLSPSPSASVFACLNAFLNEWSTEYVGRTEDGHGTPRGDRLRAQIHQSPVNIVYSLLFFYAELCSKARPCASTPWLTSGWSSTALLLTRRGPTISGWHILGRSPTLDLAR